MSDDQAEAKCPDPERIVRYVMWLLSKEEEDEIEIHLANCANCRLEATSLFDALEDAYS